MKFSVTIPAYKSVFLKEAVESVLSQTYTDWELIVVDDCSPEDLLSVVRPCLSDERIHYYRNEKNCGAVNVVDNWNVCLSRCTGDYVICMGDDDRLLPCCLEEYAKLISRHPGLNVYHARTEIINGRGDVTARQEERPEWESVLSLTWNRWNSRNRQYIGDFCYRVGHLTAVGGYCKLPLAWGSDDMTAARAAKELGIANTQTFCFQYRENDHTISSSTSFPRIKTQAMLTQYAWFGDLLQELSQTPLSEADQTLLATISAPRRDYYRKSFGKNVIDDVRGNPLRLAWHYRRLRPLRYPLTTFVRWYVSSVYHRIFDSISRKS